MENENWKCIKGFEGLYHITDHGRVYSVSRKKYKTLRIKKGYAVVGLSLKNKQKFFYVHRIVGFHFLNKPDWANQINHIDGNKLNNHYLNLEWTTAKLNIAHSIRTGLASDKKGSGNPRARLSDQDIKEIIKLRKNKVRSIDLAEQFGVSQGHIQRITSGRRWGHIH